MRLANAQLCQELFTALGKPTTSIKEHELWALDDKGKPLGLATDGFDLGKFKEFVPAYSLGYLVDLALETGHIHVKIKHGEKGVIITAPPCYHIEAQTPADGVAKLLIRSAKKGIIS